MKRIDIDSLIKIARPLDVTADYFGNDSGEINSSSTVHPLTSHFNESGYTQEELDEIYQFAEFVKNVERRTTL